MNALVHLLTIINNPLLWLRRTLLILAVFLVPSSYATTLPTKLVFNKPVDTELSRQLIKRLMMNYSAIGVEIEIIDFDHKSSLNAANNGELDGQLGRILGLSQHYPNLIASKTPLIDLNLILLTNKNKCLPCDIHALKTISHNASYPFAQKFIEQNSYQGEVIANSNLSSQLYMLKHNAIDGVLVLEYLLDHLIDDALLNQFDQHLVSRKPIHHYLHKKHKVILDKLDSELMRSNWRQLKYKTPRE